MTAHNESCRAVGVSFIPMVVESLGGWSEEASLTISRIGCHLCQRTGSSREKPPATSFNVLPSPCGEVAQACGSTVCPPPLPGLTETLVFLFSTSLCFPKPLVLSFLSHPLQVYYYFHLVCLFLVVLLLFWFVLFCCYFFWFLLLFCFYFFVVVFCCCFFPLH